VSVMGIFSFVLTMPPLAAGQARPAADGISAAELEKVYPSYRFENVTQAEAEALFASAVAAIYWPDLREVRMLSDDRLESTRTFLAMKARQDVAVSAATATPSASFLGLKLEEQGSKKLGEFLAALPEAGIVESSGVEGAFLAKVPISMPLSPTRASTPKPLPVGTLATQYYIYEDFEGDVWSRWDRDDNTGGQYTWGIRSCDAYRGSYSADAARGGSLGATLSCTSSYPANLDMSMSAEVCATIQPNWLAYIELQYKGSMDPNSQNDRFSVCMDGPDEVCWGWVFWGNSSSGWYNLVFNARQWYHLGDLAANYCNTLKLTFKTDGSNAGSGFGARVDDLWILYGDYVSSRECSVIADPTSGTSPLTVAFRPVTDMYLPTYRWFFGDGTTSEAREPVHTYYSPGDYEAAMRLWSNGTTCYASKTIHVTQGTCTYQLGTGSASFDHSGGTGVVTVLASTSSCAWQALSNDSWITLTGEATGVGNGTVTYSVAANTSTSPRTGTLSIAGHVFTVTQAARSCSYTITPSSSSFSASGGSSSLYVDTQTGCNWSAASNVDWIVITSGSSGSGPLRVYYSVGENAAASSRVGTLTVAGQTFTVNQAGVPCSFTISPTNQSFPSTGGAGTVNVSATMPTCTWGAASNAAWITITRTSGSGSGQVGFDVGSNSGSPRTGTISIAGWTFTVQQDGEPSTCPFSYWVPVMSHASGSNNSQWRTDLGLLNRGDDVANVTLTLYSGGAPATRRLTQAARAQAIIPDAAQWISDGFNGTGALHVCSDQRVTLTSRTYNLVSGQASCYPSGTFGQFYGAVQTSETLAPGETGWLAGLTENTSFRCNIGLVNTSTSDATARVTLHGVLGETLATYDVRLTPGQLKQENRPFFTKAGLAKLNRGYATVQMLAGSGIVAYASVIDNLTNDPVTIPMEK